MVAPVAPDAADDEAAGKTGALTAARDGAVGRSGLKRFAEWALSVVGRGTTAAFVAAITAATTEMLNEAGRPTSL